MSSIRSASSRTKISIVLKSNTSLVHQVQQPAGRGHENIDAALHIADLRILIHAAVNHGLAKPGSAVRLKAFGRSGRPIRGSAKESACESASACAGSVCGRIAAWPDCGCPDCAWPACGWPACIKPCKIGNANAAVFRSPFWRNPTGRGHSSRAGWPALESEWERCNPRSHRRQDELREPRHIKTHSNSLSKPCQSTCTGIRGEFRAREAAYESLQAQL